MVCDPAPGPTGRPREAQPATSLLPVRAIRWIFSAPETAAGMHGIHTSYGPATDRLRTSYASPTMNYEQTTDRLQTRYTIARVHHSISTMPSQLLKHGRCHPWVFGAGSNMAHPRPHRHAPVRYTGCPAGKFNAVRSRLLR